MAIVKCKECSGSVSDTASRCPHCGAKRSAKTTRTTWLVAAFILITISSLIISDQFEHQTPVDSNVGVRSLEKKQEYKSDSQYSIKNVASYIGKFNVDLASDYEADIKENGNITIDKNGYRTFFQSNRNKINYIQIEFSNIIPCTSDRLKLSEKYLDIIGYSIKDLTARPVSGNLRGYVNNERTLFFTVGCQHSELPLTVSIRKAL